MWMSTSPLGLLKGVLDAPLWNVASIEGLLDQVGLLFARVQAIKNKAM